ncbi:hypothetical protein [Scytonema sp. PCC 10023]|uniref:hypothetical protein n=1 Tax=Scytonema sp. PCC 10023 TaxID=1680591 RepID=UPI0039C610C8
MKFSVKSVYPISTSLRVANCRFSWKSAAVGVEYLFMGDGSRNKWQLTEGNYDSRYANIGVLNAARKLKQRSGRYRQQHAVPI